MLKIKTEGIEGEYCQVAAKLYFPLIFSLVKYFADFLSPFFSSPAIFP